MQASLFSRLPVRPRHSFLHGLAPKHVFTDCISSQAHVMFAKAIQDHSPVKKPRSASTLKPLSTATPNVTRPVRPIVHNPLKRTAAQANLKTSKLHRRDSGMSNESFNGSGRVGQLHEAVYFDENDFDNDEDIDLNADYQSSSSTVTYPTLPVQAQTLYPNLTLASSTDATLLASTLAPSTDATLLPSTLRSTTNATLLASSAEIPWSSSPIQHKLPRPPQPAPVVRTDTINMTNKRRKLPWGDDTQEPSIVERSNGQDSGLKRNVQGIIDRAKSQNVTGGNDAASTPKQRDQIKSPYPWNKSASAVKEDQKRLRQSRKKIAGEGGEASENTDSNKRRSIIPRIYLSDEQKKILTLVTEHKKSVFFTGSAGTGKSVLMREIIKTLRSKFKTQPDRIAITASTGLAACNVGGVTLHSFAGIGLGKDDVPELVKKIKRNQKAKTRWMRTQILVVDEISMVDGDLFDKLEAIARNIRNNGRPFGGIQLVITGDFFQLPPVPDYGKIAKFSFDAATWNTSIEHTIGLTQVFRQKDPAFANMLNEMRLGRLTSQSIEAFRSLDRPLDSDNDFAATELFSTRQEVDAANNNRMRNLIGRTWDYRADDGGSITDISQRDKLLSNCMAAPMLSLKKGAQVMLIKNIDETLVNGSIGRVIAFMDERTFDYYHEHEEEFQAINNSDLDENEMSPTRKKIRAMFNKELIMNDTSHKWPLVQFLLADGSTRQILLHKESWKIELPNGEVQASRSQVPLILAWALSIHKAQGQTLERVKVDLGRIFEKGQAYVALSRATCQEGLQVLRFDPKKVLAHEKVRAFYDSLYSVDEAR